MAYLDISAATPVLKELYDGQVPANLVYKNRPFLAMLTKDTSFTGKVYPLPLQYANSQGGSATFSSAQGNQSAPSFAEFLLTRASDYSLGTITGEMVLAGDGTKGSFVKLVKKASDSAFDTAGRRLSSAAFRSGTGSIGAIGTITTGVMVLADPNSVVQFEVNQVLNANATDGGTPRAAKGYVIAVDRSAGNVTVSATAGGSAGTPTGWQAADFLLIDGDVNLKLKGLAAWLPTTAPTAGDNFFGVDRSKDVVRLSGVRYDGSAQGIDEALVDAAMLCGREGGMPNVCIMNYASYGALEKALMGKLIREDITLGEISFKSIVLNGANTTINVVADRDCPSQTAYLLQTDTWGLYSAGEAPQIFDLDNNPILRVPAADAYEIRVGGYMQLGCSAPGWNATVKLSQ